MSSREDRLRLRGMTTFPFLSSLVAGGLLLLGLFPAHHTAAQEPKAAAMASAPTPKILPFLWFDHDAEEAIRFYQQVFPGTKVLGQSRWGDGGPVPKGALMTARIEICGQQLMLLNGGPTYRLTEAVSLMVSCDNQAEIDSLWTKLTAGGGEQQQCGWLKDRFGLSWQILPSNLGALLTDPDPERARRAAAAMMGMKKLDIAALQRAADGR